MSSLSRPDAHYKVRRIFVWRNARDTLRGDFSQQFFSGATHMWQDYTIAVVQVVLTMSLIPMVRQKEKPPLSSSVPTAMGLAVISFAFATLGFWFSMVSAGIPSLLWFVLVFQKSKNICAVRR